jgi:hypothetical protein
MIALIKEFRWSLFFTFLAMAIAWQWAGWTGLFTVAILIVLEVSLSFDNAVVNATILEKMDPVWQRRFLTWGILIAVFGMRVLFPLVIVAVIANLSLWEVANLAFYDADTYAKHLSESHVQVAAFGGMFLLMVFLGFFFDKEKDIHWLGVIERSLSKVGNLESVELILAIVILMISVHYLPEAVQFEAIIAGLMGMVLYVSLNSLNNWMEAGIDVTGTAARAGLVSFLYLEVLDASFSFDGVIGAFAITKDIVIIMLGLGIGALFVRTITISLVEHGVLNQYIYLSHGAHYAIGALATIMILSMHTHVPEVITGLIGAVFIGAGVWSSVRFNRKQLAQSVE